MIAATGIQTLITSLQQEIATQEASSPLYAQRDALQAQLTTVLQQIAALEAATDVRNARVTLSKLQNLQGAGVIPGPPVAQGV